MRVLETKPRGQNLGTGRLGLRKTFAAADFFSWNDFALYSGQPRIECGIQPPCVPLTCDPLTCDPLTCDPLKRGELAGTNAYFAKEASSFFITCNRSRTSFWVACRAVAIAESLSRGLEVVDDVVSGS